MASGTERGVQTTRPETESEHCLLLIRAPSDRRIYDAFRSLAAHGRAELRQEHLWIEGDIPLTAGLSAPQIPPTLERLLEADCEMIDTLELQLDALRITYMRSGGHAPFRESFFDEVRLDVADPASFDRHHIGALIQVMFETLQVVSHSATPLFAEVVGQIASDADHSAKHPVHGSASPS